MKAKSKGPELTPEEEQARQEKIRRQRRKAFLWMLLRMALLLTVVYVLFFHLVGLTVMPSNDMYPRLDAGDLVLYYRLDKDPQFQDVIVLDKDAAELRQLVEEQNVEAGEEGALPADITIGAGAPAKKSLWRRIGEAIGLYRPQGRQQFVCRVVAAAGDTVEITVEGRLLVNGNAVVERGINAQTMPYGGFVEYPLTLGEGECFVLADQRSDGADSRFFGPVRTEDILGTVITVVRRNNL